MSSQLLLHPREQNFKKTSIRLRVFVCRTFKPFIRKLFYSRFYYPASLDEAEKFSYRYLLYTLLLEISTLDERMINWTSQHERDSYVRKMLNMSAIAEWLHNLAFFSASDFQGFSEQLFWDLLKYSGHDDYKQAFDTYLNKFCIQAPHIFFTSESAINYAGQSHSPLNKSETFAYRFLIYEMMVQFRFLVSRYRNLRENEENLDNFLDETTYFTAVANWLYPLAYSSTIDFADFDRQLFWQRYDKYNNSHPTNHEHKYKLDYQDSFIRGLRQFHSIQQKRNYDKRLI